MYIHLFRVIVLDQPLHQPHQNRIHLQAATPDTAAPAQAKKVITHTGEKTHGFNREDDSQLFFKNFLEAHCKMKLKQ